MAVVDGLGHGVEAAIAAIAAIRTLESHDELSLVPLVKACHASLKNTRGVVLSVAHCCEVTGLLKWLGVGNVEALIARVDYGKLIKVDHLMLRNGIVGMMLPSLLVSEQVLTPDDLVVLASDGIRRGFHAGLDPSGDPSLIAARILEGYGRQDDDAMVLVVRYLGPEPPDEN